MNKDKTKVTIFGKGGILRCDLKKYQGQDMEIVRSYSYLGITFTAGNSFFECTSYTIRSSTKSNF